MNWPTGTPRSSRMFLETSSAILEAWEWLRVILLGAREAEPPVLLNRYARVALSSAMALAAFVMLGLLSGSSPETVYKAF